LIMLQTAMRSLFLAVFFALIAASVAQLRVRDLAQIGDFDEPHFKPIVRARNLSSSSSSEKSPTTKSTKSTKKSKTNDSAKSTKKSSDKSTKKTSSIQTTSRRI
jgi:hypothetical protein